MTTRLEDLKPEALVQGLVGREAVRMVTAEMLGEAACKVVYRSQDGALGEQLLFRSNEAELELVGSGRKWSFEGSGDLFRLVSEAARIELAYLFDPYVAVSSSTNRAGELGSSEGGEPGAVLMKSDKTEEKYRKRYATILYILPRKKSRAFFTYLLLASTLITVTASPAKAGIVTEIVEWVIRIGGHLLVRIGTKNPELAPYIWTAIGTLVVAAIIYTLLKAIKKWEEDRELSSRIYIDETRNKPRQIIHGKWQFIAGLTILGGIAASLYWPASFRRDIATKSPPKAESKTYTEDSTTEDQPKPEWWEKGSDPDEYPTKESWGKQRNTPNQSPRAKKSPPVTPKKAYDAAIAMQQKVFYYPDDSLPSLKTDDYKKAAGDLARIQHKLLINRGRSKDLPTVLIGLGVWKNEKCNQRLPSIGIYQYGGTDCDQLITVNFTDGNLWYEHQIEIIITLAHEWGHHIINLSGEKVSGISNELLSDCFAGVYLAYLHKHGALSEQEFYNGVRLMTQIGNTHGTGIHGSSYQRRNGLISGYGRAFNQYDQESQANWDSYCKGLENVIDLSRGLP